MRKTLLSTFLVIPFFWSLSDLKKPSKKPAHPPAKVWSLPDAITKVVTASPIYKAVESWVQKLWPF